MKKKSDDEKEAFLQDIRTQKEEILNLQDLLVDRLTDAIKESDDWKNLSPYHLKTDKKEKLALDKIIKSTVSRFYPLAVRLGVQIQISAENRELYVYAAEKHMHRIFENILDNSLKYMNRQGVITITLSEFDDSLFLVIKDNGVGIKSEETEKIFSKFYQGENSIAGMGLGLAQVKEIVEFYHGSVYAKSESGKGMAIYINMKKG